MHGHEMGTHILWVARKVVSYSGKHFENHINNHNTFHTFNPQISAIHCRITYIGEKKKGSHRNIQQLNELWYVVQ